MLNLAEQVPGKRLRLHYLDGLRGIAALYVVFSHVWEMQPTELPSLWMSLSKIFQYGSFSVSVFIVLSGYCLMLPVSRSQAGSLSIKFSDFIQRRARRILPPYYAALVLSIAVGLLLTLLVRLQLFLDALFFAFGDFFKLVIYGGARGLSEF
ncbi:MAG: acyltransferase [Synechococcales cyanobacterium RU_4_20]|nr:acyltransferase [Synechococcales cyanobacterium RU_4_20]